MRQKKITLVITRGGGYTGWRSWSPTSICIIVVFYETAKVHGRFRIYAVLKLPTRKKWMILIFASFHFHPLLFHTPLYSHSHFILNKKKEKLGSERMRLFQHWLLTQQVVARDQEIMKKFQEWVTMFQNVLISQIRFKIKGLLVEISREIFERFNLWK